MSKLTKQDLIDLFVGRSDEYWGAAPCPTSGEIQTPEGLPFLGGGLGICVEIKKKLKGIATVELAGFYSWDNPDCEIVRYEEGIDFCWIDSRYVVDIWSKEVAGHFKRCPVFDMQNNIDRAAVWEWYGDMQNWEFNTDWD